MTLSVVCARVVVANAAEPWNNVSLVRGSRVVIVTLGRVPRGVEHARKGEI